MDIELSTQVQPSGSYQGLGRAS